MGGRAARSPRCAKIVKRAEPVASGDLADSGSSGEFSTPNFPAAAAAADVAQREPQVH